MNYYVANDNALCYAEDDWHFLGVLAGDVWKGGPDPMQGIMVRPMDPAMLRKATVEDFDRFRVSSKGYAL